MINSLTLRNFRAFKNQTFRFSRINLFIGPNNSGKSSAISALNLIAQTILNRHERAGPLILNGPFDQLGTFIDAVHGNWSNTPMGIDFSFGADMNVALEFKYRKQRREIELIRFELARKTRRIYRYTAKKDGFDVRIGENTLEELIGSEAKRKPDFVGFWPFDRTLSRSVYDSENMSSQDDNWKILRSHNHDLMRASQNLIRTFSKFDALGPFRDQPQRTYLYSGEVAAVVGKTGSNSVTMLAADTSRRGSQRLGMIEEISRWLKITNIAKGISVKALTPRHFEVCVIGHDGTMHNICDVGFGCSQVLPVLIGGLNLFRTHGERKATSPSPIYVVHEPEIHLHPNAQAALGSFFAGIVPQNGQIFVETHSDTLVLRIARHVALGQLQPEDVTVFFTTDEGGIKSVYPLMPDADGVFKPDWPGGFFPQRQTESLALAKARFQRESTSKPAQADLFYPET